MLDDDFPMNVHTKSMTEKFDKEKLVYLTPHCNHDLVEFNHNDIYIIGAMVDKTNNEPLSLAKAKKQGLRMARLPLDRYLSWGAGSGKSLTLNQMVNIMLEMKKHGDWERALRFVPRRKVMDEKEFHERQSYNNLQKFSQDNRPSFDSKTQNKSYEDRLSYNNRRDFSNNNAREFQKRRNLKEYPAGSQRNQFNDNREDYRQEPRSFSHENSRSFKERKHFDKFKFNLDTWGKKMNQK